MRIRYKSICRQWRNTYRIPVFISNKSSITVGIIAISFFYYYRLFEISCVCRSENDTCGYVSIASCASCRACTKSVAKQFPDIITLIKNIHITTFIFFILHHLILFFLQLIQSWLSHYYLNDCTPRHLYPSVIFDSLIETYFYSQPICVDTPFPSLLFMPASVFNLAANAKHCFFADLPVPAYSDLPAVKHAVSYKQPFLLPYPHRR